MWEVTVTKGEGGDGGLGGWEVTVTRGEGGGGRARGKGGDSHNGEGGGGRAGGGGMGVDSHQRGRRVIIGKVIIMGKSGS